MPTGHYYCLPAARLFKLFEFGMELFCVIGGLTSSRNRRPKFCMFLLNDLYLITPVYVFLSLTFIMSTHFYQLFVGNWIFY